MQMRSSARSRYGAPRSASLKTATTSMPRSRHARMTRRAISPRLATMMRWNIGLVSDEWLVRFKPTGGNPWEFAFPRVATRGLGCRSPCTTRSARGIDAEKHRLELNRLLVLHEHFGDDARTLGLDLVEDL